VTGAWPPGECVVYEPDGDDRRYWQGKSTRVWRGGEVGRAGAARFPNMPAARAAIAASRTQRRKLPRLGYEWLPLKVEQLQLIEGTNG
jgi:hypothetical protein